MVVRDERRTVGVELESSFVHDGQAGLEDEAGYVKMTGSKVFRLLWVSAGAILKARGN